MAKVDWNNPDDVRKYQREWRRANVEKARASAARYRERNREKVRQKERDWARKDRQENPGKYRQIDAKNYARTRTDWYKKLMVAKSTAKARATQKGIEFSLSIQWVKDTAAKLEADPRCPYTGVVLTLDVSEANVFEWNGPALDRIDPTKGYTPDNVLVVSNFANHAKGRMSKDQFLSVMASAGEYASTLLQKEGKTSCQTN